MDSSPTMFTTMRLSIVLIPLIVIVAVAAIVALVAIVARGRNARTWLLVLCGLAAAGIALPLLLLCGALFSRPSLTTNSTEIATAKKWSNPPENMAVATTASTAKFANEEAIVYPDNRPEWVVVGPTYQPGLNEFTISSDPFATRTDAIQQLEQRLSETLGEYAAHLKRDSEARTIIAREAAEAIRHLQVEPTAARSVSLQENEGKLLDNVYIEKVTFPQPVGAMYQVHARVVANEPFLQFVDDRYRAIESQRRLVSVGTTAGAVVLGLLLLSAGLRIGSRMTVDRRRLQGSAAVAILLSVVMCDALMCV